MFAVMSGIHLKELQEVCFSLKAGNFDKKKIGLATCLWFGEAGCWGIKVYSMLLSNNGCAAKFS